MNRDIKFGYEQIYLDLPCSSTVDLNVNNIEQQFGVGHRNVPLHLFAGDIFASAEILHFSILQYLNQILTWLKHVNSDSV